MLPKEDYYAPPMNIKVKDHRSFGRRPIVGFHIIKSLELFRSNPSLPSLTLTHTDNKSFSSSLTEEHAIAASDSILLPIDQQLVKDFFLFDDERIEFFVEFSFVERRTCFNQK